MPIPDWRKSSYCQEGEACLHVAAQARKVLLTESADRAHAILSAAPATFAAMLVQIKAAYE